MLLKARVVRHGSEQAILLPKDIRFTGTEVCIKRVGDAMLLFPLEKAWNLMADAMGKADPDFLPERGQPKATERRKPLR